MKSAGQSGERRNFSKREARAEPESPASVEPLGTYSPNRFQISVIHTQRHSLVFGNLSE